MLTEELKNVVAQFQLCGKVERIEKFGSGNINDTYRSVMRGSSPVSYIHQKINKTVFPHPKKVMENMALVTSHIQKKLRQEYAESQSVRRATLQLIPTKEGLPYYVDSQGEYWRTTVFIPDALTYDVVQNLEHAYEVGRILGEFQRLVTDISPEQLHDTLPGFHHTPVYYYHFLHSLETIHPDPAIDARKQEPDAVELIQKIQQHESLVPLLMEAYNSGILRDRIVHNDPKINNILIDTQTHKGICIIDLDTVKSGPIHFDYGDCLRSAANPAGEETRDTHHVRFDLKIFEWITRGYLEETQAFLSETDLDYLVDSIKVLIFESVIRFFTDYLKGDVYFKISYPTQNLNRTKVQFVLLEDIERREAKVREIMRTLIRNA